MGLNRRVVAIDSELLDRSRGIARMILTVSVGLFFFSVVALAAPIGDPLFAENMAAGLMLAIALCGFVHLGLWFERRA